LISFPLVFWFPGFGLVLFLLSGFSFLRLNNHLIIIIALSVVTITSPPDSFSFSFSQSSLVSSRFP
jgi:hypothetical protein